MNASRPTCCSSVAPGPDATTLARRFKAMGDPTRLTILDLLRRCEESLCACEIESCFDLSQPTISHHLRLLRQAGLVEAERRGTWMHFRLVPDAIETIEDFARGLHRANATST